MALKNQKHFVIFDERGYNEVLFRLPTEIISKEELVKKINDWQNGKLRELVDSYKKEETNEG